MKRRPLDRISMNSSCLSNGFIVSRFAGIRSNGGGMVSWGLEPTNLSTEYKLNKYNK